MKKLELLSPAGNILKMRTAFAAGADAVYLGIPDFSLRVRINDFDSNGVSQAIKEAHGQKKKVYVTLNIFAHNKHLEKLPEYVKKIKAMAPDGLIISDPGVAFKSPAMTNGSSSVEATTLIFSICNCRFDTSDCESRCVLLIRTAFPSGNVIFAVTITRGSPLVPALVGS